MKNNVIKPIQIDSGKRPRSRFNLSYDVNTTSDWGSAQTIVSRFMYPNTKNVCQVESLVRLAPMVCPTFGRVVAKQYHQFVDIEDIFPPFPALMNASVYNGAGGYSYVPQAVPRMPLALLSLFVLAGAKFTFFFGGSSDSSTSATASLFKSSFSDYSNHLNALRSKFSMASSSNLQKTINGVNVFIEQYTGSVLDATAFLDTNTQTWIKTLGNHNYLTQILIPFDGYDSPMYSDDYVSLEGADLVIPFWITINGADKVGYAAARLSSFGCRLRKILIGNGYQVDLQSREVVSLLPLMATYKAYYDIFGLTGYSNYQDTTLAKMSALMSNGGLDVTDCARSFTNNTSVTTANADRNLTLLFIYSLGLLFYTENVDYISAHQPSSTLAGSPDGVNDPDKYLNVGSSSNIDLKSNIGVSRDYKDASIKANPFSQLDIELLKRLYRWSNVQSVAGKQIADALRAAGFDSFVDSCKSNFIGSSEQMITISDVVSTSDTYDTGNSKTGAVLGEYGGRGLGYDDSNALSFETDKFGYWIGLFFIVPKSGYSQGLDQTLIDTERFDFYNPQFDALGYQMDAKSVVNSAIDFGEFPYPDQRVSFGLIPRYTEWKVQKNISNGDFSLRSTRNTYLPYCLDKELPVGERSISKGSDTANVLNWLLDKAFGRSYVPTSGDVWRYLGKYPWMGLFDRIFARFGEDDVYKRISVYFDGGADNIGFTIRNDDNFLCHFIVNLQSYAPMLPVEKSFQTDDDGSFDGSVEKA